MNLEIISYNGVSLNDASFKAYFPVPSVMIGPDVDIGEVERSYFAPITTYKKRKSKFVFIHVRMLGTIPSNIDTLNALFNPYDPDQHKLLVKDLNDSDKQYYVMGTPGGHPDWDGEELVVSVKVDDPIWKTETESSTTWNVTGTGDQETINVGGSFYAEPTFEITPTAAKAGGKAYRIFCPIYNPSTTITYTDYPLDIVNNALDTAALIASTSKSNQINQVGGIGTDLTPFPIDTPVGGGLPASGMGYVGTEQISFTISGSTLTPTARGLNGTTPATHADNAIIYLSLMEANGGDIRVTVDGIQDNFWLQDINNATSQIWINVDLSPGYTMTNGVLIASSGAISTITLGNSTANIDAINALPSNGSLMIDSELFTYTGKNTMTRQFTGVSRSAHNTSMAEHTVGDYVRWIEREIYIYHGVHDFPAFTVNDDYKPYIELDSTNSSWTWDARFATTNASKLWRLGVGRWRGTAPAKWSDANYYDHDYSAVYSYGYYEPMATTSPSLQTNETDVTFSVLGQYYVNTGYYPKFHYNDALIPNSGQPHVVYLPSGYTHVSANGNKWLANTAGADWYRTDAGFYMFRKVYAPSPAALYGVDSFSDAFSVAAPISTNTVESWSQATLDLGGTYNYLVFAPQRGANKDGEVRIEVTDLTVTLSPDAIPVASVGSSIEYYHISAALINTTTGYYIDIDYNLNLNTTLIINTSGHTVVNNDNGTYERGAIQLSTYRHDWLRMAPGANVLQWDETGATGLTIVVKRRERKL